MQEQMGFMDFFLLLAVAVATIVVHSKLKSMGYLVWAILATLAGFGLMLFIVL